MTLLSGTPRSLSAWLAACLMAGTAQAQTPQFQKPRTAAPVRAQVQSSAPISDGQVRRVNYGDVLQSSYDPQFGTEYDGAIYYEDGHFGAPCPPGCDDGFAPNMIGDFVGAGRPVQYQFNPGGTAAPINFSQGYGLFEGLTPGFIPGTSTNQVNPVLGLGNVPLTGNQMFQINEAQGTLGNVPLPVTTLTATTPGHPNPGAMAPPVITTIGQAPVLNDVFTAPTLDPNALFLLTDPNNSSYTARLRNLTLSGAPGLNDQITAFNTAIANAGVTGTLTQLTAHSAALDSTVATLAEIPDFTDLNGDGVPSPGEQFTDFNANNTPDPGEFNDINMDGILDPGEQFDHNGNGMIDGEFTYLINPITVFTPGAYSFTQDPITFALPQAPGALVGRQKIGENGSPRPRQRYFFNYNYFDNTNFGGNSMNRFTLGFEKTFLDEQASLEVRFPIASQVTSDITAGSLSNAGNTSMGDLTAFLKYVLYDDSEILMSIGTGVSLPTADDVIVRDANGTKLVSIENEAVHILPFVGFVSDASYSNFFMQGFVQGDIDLSGNPVKVTGFQQSQIAYQTGNTIQMFNLQRPTGVLQDAGEVKDSARLMVDLNIGYWIHNPMPYVQKIAPMMELHINTELDTADVISTPTLVGVAQSSLTTINGTVGLTAVLNPRFTANVGYSFPLSDDKYSELDGEFRAFFNWYFPNGFRNL